MSFQSDLFKSLTQDQSPSLNIKNTPIVKLVNPDTEPIIEVDADKRKITVPDELKNVGVAGDQNCEEVIFKIARYFDDEDLSNHTCLIRIVNAKGEYCERPTRIVELGTDYIKFGWKLDNYVTRYSGEIRFTVQFETVDDGIKYQWQTTPATLNILAGLNIENTITDKDDTLFRNISNRLDDLERQMNELVNVNSNIQNLSDKIDVNANDIQYLKDNVVYVLDESEVTD